MPIPIDISASTCAGILNVSKWESQYSAWQNLMERREPGFNAAHGLELPEQPDNASIRWGKAFEDAICDLAGIKQNDKIIDREKFVRHKKYKFLTCHIDGIYDRLAVIAENKTTSIYTWQDEWGEPETDRVPLDIRVQAEHQMLCTGHERNIISVLTFPKRPDEWEEIGLETNGDQLTKYEKIIGSIFSMAYTLFNMGYFHQYPIDANKELQEMIIDYVVPWWEKHVINKIPPQPGNYPDLTRMIKKPVGTIICPPEMEDWKNEYQQINMEENRLSARQVQIKENVIKYGRQSAEGIGNPVDSDSTKKWVFRSDFHGMVKLFAWEARNEKIT